MLNGKSSYTDIPQMYVSSLFSKKLIDIYYTVKVDSNLKIDSDLDFNIRCVFTKSFVLENVAHVKFLDYGMEVNFKF